MTYELVCSKCGLKSTIPDASIADLCQRCGYVYNGKLDNWCLLGRHFMHDDSQKMKFYAEDIQILHDKIIEGISELEYGDWIKCTKKSVIDMINKRFGVE